MPRYKSPYTKLYTITIKSLAFWSVFHFIYLFMAISFTENSLSSYSNPMSSWDHNIDLVAQPTRPSEKIVTINVTRGMDVIKTIIDVARRDDASLIVLNASGMIDSVTLCNTSQGPTAFVFYGPFALLSLIGFYLHNNHNILDSEVTPPSQSSFGINLSTFHGRVFRGLIGSRVIAGDNVSIMVSIFRNSNINKKIPDARKGSTMTTTRIMTIILMISMGVATCLGSIWMVA